MKRQGDILFKLVDEKVDGKPTKQLVIAEGEVTGHQHLLVAETNSKIKGTNTLFMLTGKAKLYHPEHDTIEFGAGTYQVINEREFDYISEEMKKVID